MVDTDLVGEKNNFDWWLIKETKKVLIVLQNHGKTGASPTYW
jgi:hypothetical protein